LVGQLERLQTWLLEHKDVAAENEEMLVQFGLMKQQMDDSAEFIQGLKIENASLHAKIGGDVANFTNVYNDRMSRRNEQLESQAHELLQERDRLNEQVNGLELAISELRQMHSFNNDDEDAHSGVFANQNGDVDHDEGQETHHDNEEELRAIVVSLAAALERSELLRASAMERVMVERESHAKSVRSLSNNVRRFYSSFAIGDI
jgi:hypothetical protein